MRRRSYRMLGLICLAAILTLVTSCCNASDALRNAITTPAAAGNTRPAAGGELRLSGPDPMTLDPALSQDVSSWSYMLHIFSGLVSLDDNLKVVPEIAESWTVSKDGRTYTFKLRTDAVFQDGRAITANDFKYSFERTCDPKLKSPVAQTYLGDIVGVQERLQGKAKEIKGITVKDDYTIEITIDAPKEYFLSKLTYSTGYVLDKANVDKGSNWFKSPNGSGPFKLEAWKTDDSITLTRNDKYYGQKPLLERVTFELGGGSPISLYEQGKLDVAEVGLADIDRVTDKTNPLNKELQVKPQLELTYLGLNTKLKPFDDVKVRQAFVMALDREKLAKVTFKGTMVNAVGIVPPGLPGYQNAAAPLQFDVEGARRLLRESSYGGPDNLPQIVFSASVGGGGLANNLAEIYRKALGVDVVVEQVEDTFYDELSDGKLQMFIMGWGADYPDPQNFLDILFHTGSEPNHSLYSNSNVDRILEQARGEQNAARRYALYAEAERIILTEAPVIPLYHDVDYTLVKPYVRGLTLTPMGIISLKNIQLSRD